MKVFASPNFRNAGFFLLLTSFCCAPVWAVEYFINQDGSAHLYSSYIMLELFKGNPAIGEFFAFNSISIPNSSGHWLMTLLLNFFSPFIITKILVTLTFAGFVASVGWLRFTTNGIDGLKTSFLIGAAIGFNWLWFGGFYNFLIGVCCFVLTVGLFFSWREKMNLWRALVLALLFLLAYFSHIISFAVLAGSVFLLAFSSPKEQIKKNLFWIFAAFLPVLPFLIIYKSVSASGGGFFPVWRSLENSLSLVSWFSQIRSADSFIIISRKTFPFVSENSNYFVVFTPILWILAALFFLTIGSFSNNEKSVLFSKTNLIFAFSLVSAVLAAALAPDDFGLNNGSVLRERLLICGLIFFVPLFQTGNSIRFKRIAQICLVFVIVFQTGALWEYSLSTNQKAKEFFAAQTQISPNAKLASIIIVDDDSRFHSIPMTMINNYSGIAPDRIVWDNYEIGHYLFPVVAKYEVDKRFVFDLTRSNSFSLNLSSEQFNEKLSLLEKTLAENNHKIDILLVWGKDSRVEAVLDNWLEKDASYESQNLRIYRRKIKPIISLLKHKTFGIIEK